MTRIASDALVFFGATGDLARKQIFPALQSMIAHGRLNVPIIGVAKAGWKLDDLRRRARESVTDHGGLDEQAFAKMIGLLDYIDGDYADPATFVELRKRLGDAKHPTHYLAVPPQLFKVVVAHLDASGCAKGARVVVEKPFGHDLPTAKSLNDALHKVFAEEDIYRIDHFLGKEAVQNLIVFRFANRVFQPVWNAENIRDVQITMAESFGIEGRGSMYDAVGAVRDVVQNHLLQVLALLTMEPPDASHHESIRDEAGKVLQKVKPIHPNEIVLGQFAGYRDEHGVRPDSKVETFAALRLEIDTPRWKGVPFFIRTGKKLACTATEVIVNFAPSPVADYAAGCCNRLRFRVGPELTIALTTEVKRPGETMAADSIELTFMHQPDKSEMTAYERLLGDAMIGDPTLFAREDAVEASWAIVDRVIDGTLPVVTYPPGSWGPKSVDELTEGVGGWINPDAKASTLHDLPE